MEFRGLMGGFYRISEWIMRFSVTNVLWIVTALPVFFFVLTLFIAEDVGQAQASIFAIIVLSPFLLFPSTAAMFALARKWATGDEDAPLLKTFFKGYKENYLQSMFGGILFTVLMAVLIFNFRFYNSQTGYGALLSYLFIALGLVISIGVFNFFCLTVHLHMKTLQLIKNSILITVGQPIRSLFIAITNFVIIYISFTQFTFLLPFFTGSVIAFLTFWHFHNGFRKMLDKYEQSKKDNNQEDADSSPTNAVDEEHNDRDRPLNDADIDKDKYRTY